jgi:uncharacterized damage-inducible protein DinB
MSNDKTMVLYNQWKTAIGWITRNLESLTDEELQKDIIPGRSNGLWLLGHLILVEDQFSVALGREARLFPELGQFFGIGTKPQLSEKLPTPAILRKQWQEVVAKSDRALQSIQDSEWGDDHGLGKDTPIGKMFQTKGDCLSTFVLHQQYHNGQLGLLLALVGKNRA